MTYRELIRRLRALTDTQKDMLAVVLVWDEFHVIDYVITMNEMDGNDELPEHHPIIEASNSLASVKRDEED
jgi:hypothetical protein